MGWKRQCSAEVAFLCHCHTKFCPTGHLAHIDFGLSQDFESFGCVEKSHAKNNIVFARNSGSCNGYFNWCNGFLNCTGPSVQ